MAVARSNPPAFTAQVRRPILRTALPGPRAAELVIRDGKALSPSYTRAYPLAIASGSGLWVTDVDGNEFLDFTAGIAVAASGHAHPRVVAAIRAQADRFLHMSGTDFYYQVEIELAERLAALAPVGPEARVFFCNSGAEAIEGAMKLARWSTRRPNFLAFEGSFHGRTLGALSLTSSKAVQREGFMPFVPGVHHVPFPSSRPGGVTTDEALGRIEELFITLAPPRSIAAVFVEPIQGEGGYLVPPDDFLPRLRALTREHGILLVADEVQSGMGRTGRMFALEHYGVQADIVTLAKGIASGMPLGAFIAGANIMAWPPGSHGSTFGGNPVSCAAALATLDLLEEGLVENAAIRGDRLLEGLQALRRRHPELLVEARGKGLMGALELISRPAAEALVQAAFERGLLLLTVGRSSIRLSPALTITEEELEVGLEILGEAVEEVAAS